MALTDQVHAPPPRWPGCHFQDGQLVRARPGHLAFTDRLGDVAIVIQSEVGSYERRRGRYATEAIGVRVLWPDGVIQLIAEHDVCHLDDARPWCASD